MAKTGKSPSQLMGQLYEMVGEHHYERRDVAFAADSRTQLQAKLDSGELKEIGGMTVMSVSTTDGHRFQFANGSWLLVRFSGTEPLLRIYAEAESPQMVGDLLDGAGKFLGV
jgi:phosphomannomutase